MLEMNRRQFLKAGTLLAAPTMLGLVGCGSAPTGSGDASSDVAEFDGTLVVGFDQEFPPYGYVGDDGEFTGFDLDLAAAVCERKGWTFTPEPIDWDAKDALLNSGQITCIWNGFTIEGREKDYAFTDAYMNNSNVVVVAADSDIKTLADLAGKSVVVQTDSGAQNVLEDEEQQAELAATFASLETIADYNTAFMALEQGTYDAIAVDEPVATFNVTGKEDTFRVLDERLNSEHFGVGFALGNEALRDEVQATLQELVADGTVEATVAKYADQGVSMDNWCLPEA
ncbi:MAG: substrate-binding domain-containing protein [Acidobacteriota bacterium]|nr:substrate-binding domain-containing protein [Acidobacteriota bacterium]